MAISKKGIDLIACLGAILVIFFAGCTDDDDDSSEGNDDVSDDDEAEDDDNDDDDSIDEPAIKVGFARVDITPDHSVIMAGYGLAVITDLLCRWSSGTHDPLYATAVAFENPYRAPIILISLDVIGVMLPDTLRIQEGVSEALGISPDSVLTTGTHNHGSPDTLGLWGVISPPQTGRDDLYIEQMINGAVEAAVLAYENRLPATLSVNIGHEESVHFNPQAEFDSEATLDNTMTLLAAYDSNDHLIGTLMNWGCHPCAMGPQNKLLTSDFVGSYYRFMDNELGGVNMFVNGALGGTVHPQDPLDPLFNLEGSQWGTWDTLDHMGRILADGAIGLLSEAQPVDDPRIKSVATTLDVQVQNPLWIANDLVPREVPDWMGWTQTKVSAFSIGDLRFGTVPGELVPNIGLELRDIMGGEQQVLINLGMDWFGYILTQKQFSNLYYIYFSAMCIGPGMEANLVNHYHAIFDEWS